MLDKYESVTAGADSTLANPLMWTEEIVDTAKDIKEKRYQLAQAIREGAEVIKEQYKREDELDELMEGRWLKDNEDFDGHDQFMDQQLDIAEMREENREANELEDMTGDWNRM